MKLLIADDHPVVRSGLRRLLPPAPETEIVEAATGTEVLALYRRERPDAVVLDINLPGVGGLELLRRLTADDPEVRILVFSMHAEPVYALQALRAGARGYVTKTAPPEEILEAIRRVADGGSYIESGLAQELALQAVPERQRADAPLPSLSARDLELLRLLGQGSSLTEMATATGVSYKTIANSLSLLKSRLGVSSTPELVRLAIKTGISP
ncbi:MAG TPA: response regulator transcription factor [Stellaceae bacterium]|nr:response regulator transcription factor [Stellaceae bacterium]